MTLDRKYLKRAYCGENKSIKEIAMDCGVSRHKIRKLLMIYNIPIHTKQEIGAHNLLGNRFGKLVVVEKCASKCPGTHWKCRCDCGQEKIVRGTSLVNELTQSCGCLWRHNSYERISGEYLSSLKYNAKRRKLKFVISPKELWEIFVKQDAKCAISNVPIIFGEGLTTTNQTASLDRIDSSKGYEIGNVRWVHKSVNQMKMDMSDEDFMKWVAVIAISQKLKL